MMITALRHFGIVVDDMEAALHFYRDLLGLEVVRDQLEEGPYIDTVLGMHGASVRTVKLGPGPQQAVQPGTTALVELLAFNASETGSIAQAALDAAGPTHVALTVDDLDSLYEWLRSAGVQFLSPPAVSPDGYAKVAFCHAPCRTFVELVELMA